MFLVFLWFLLQIFLWVICGAFFAIVTILPIIVVCGLFVLIMAATLNNLLTAVHKIPILGPIISGIIGTATSFVCLFFQGDLWPWQLLITAIVTVITLIIPGHLFKNYVLKMKNEL